MLTWLLDNGAQSLSIVGSTGENMAMSEEEQKEVLGHVASFIDGQVPLEAALENMTLIQLWI
ncbi:MAG: dihydrodipicolinate synthase family protein [Lachnospiraceae bacterium]